MAQERISIVVLTKDEAQNLPDCLASLLPQLRQGDEVLVIDSASRDRTVEIACEHEKRHPDQVRVFASDDNLSFGAARNLGIKLSEGDVVAFVSADAVAEPGWLDAMRRALDRADIVYGRQRHAPPVDNAATVSRGLRYHHFELAGDVLPETYASNVNAAYRKMVFDELTFDELAEGAEDVAFAREARFAGYRIAYAADAVVGHKDVASWKGEWRKHLREGAAHAQLRSLLGTPRLHLLWALAVGTLALLAVVLQSLALLAATVLVFFAPTLRRLRSPLARRYRAAPLLGAAAVSPIFDAAFVAAYLRKRVIS